MRKENRKNTKSPSFVLDTSRYFIVPSLEIN